VVTPITNASLTSMQFTKAIVESDKDIRKIPNAVKLKTVLIGVKNRIVESSLKIATLLESSQSV
jgi:hypothetical protein